MSVTFTTTLLGAALSATDLSFGSPQSNLTITHDSEAVGSISASTFNDIFWFQTDSNDLSDLSATDVKFAVDASNLPAEMDFGSCVVASGDIVTRGNGQAASRALKQDVANWVGSLWLGVAGLDLIENEEELVTDISGLNADLRTSMHAILAQYGGSVENPRLNVASAGADATGVESNNFARQVLMSGIASNADEMAARITTEIDIADVSQNDLSSNTLGRNPDDFLPVKFKNGDTFILYVAYGSNNNLVDSAGVTVGEPSARITAGTGYLAAGGSSNSNFVNGLAPTYGNVGGSKPGGGTYEDQLTNLAHAWRVYKITLNLIA